MEEVKSNVRVLKEELVDTSGLHNLLVVSSVLQPLKKESCVCPLDILFHWMRIMWPRKSVLQKTCLDDLTFGQKSLTFGTENTLSLVIIGKWQGESADS